MKQKNTFKWLGGITVVALIAATTFYFCCYSRSPIKEFDEKRDLPALLEMFYNDWWWLESATPEEYDPSITFKTRSPNSNVYYQGQLNIKVIYDGSELAAFVAYFKHSFYVGQLLFLDVKEKFRRKGYGEQLARYAIDQLFNTMGVMRIFIYARPNNVRAIGLYNKLGFKEVSRDNTFVTLEAYKK